MNGYGETNLFWQKRDQLKFQDFSNVGITNVKDIMQPNGTFYSMNELNRKFNLSASFLHILGMRGN